MQGAGLIHKGALVAGHVTNVCRIYVLIVAGHKTCETTEFIKKLLTFG